MLNADKVFESRLGLHSRTAGDIPGATSVSITLPQSSEVGAGFPFDFRAIPVQT